MVGLIFSKHKGQVAFEFIIVLSVVLFLSSAIILDFYNEANLSLMAGYSKNLVEAQMGTLQVDNKLCIGSYLESFDIVDKTFMFVVRSRAKACKPDDGEVAQKVEQALCGGKSNGNNIIECGINDYIVAIEWKVAQ